MTSIQDKVVISVGVEQRLMDSAEGATISKVAGAIADPTRSEILLALMDGRAYPVSDIAAVSHVGLSTASHHLDVLVSAGLVRVDQLGRHRYHRLASSGVAELIEQLGVFQGATIPQPTLTGQRKSIREGRVCYNHLAGCLGVRLREGLEGNGYIRNTGLQFEMTKSGRTFFGELGIAVPETPAKACLDWTERVPHIGGALGRAICENFLERGWIIRGELPRQILVTELGRTRLDEILSRPQP